MTEQITNVMIIITAIIVGVIFASILCLAAMQVVIKKYERQVDRLLTELRQKKPPSEDGDKSENGQSQRS